MAATIEVKYFNSFLLRKTLPDTNIAIWNGSPGIPVELGGWPIDDDPGPSWVIEEARIRGGYNNTNVDYGVKAYLVEDEPAASIRGNSLIYSGIFNSRTGINDTNVFSIGAEITKSADPANGSIQKLYAEDTNLIVFQESKVSRALIDKDAIYSAEGGGSITNINTTIGTIQPYAGNFGISNDPGSFATYGYRKYFTDKKRNAILRLSKDGLTDISVYGMYDYFRDEFSRIDEQSTEGNITGGWDVYSKQYVVSTSPASDGEYNTLSFDENAKGWTSFFSYKPDHMLSLRSTFYSIHEGKLWKHYAPDVNRGSFYGIDNKTSVQFIFNPKVSVSKVFTTVNYEGSSGWQVSSFNSDETDLSGANELISFDSANPIDVTKPAVYSYNEGAYTENGVTYRVGFNRKENKYHANLLNHSFANPGEVLFGGSMTGIKGYFATVTVSTDNTTNPGGAKELFAVSSNYLESSY